MQNLKLIRSFHDYANQYKKTPKALFILGID